MAGFATQKSLASAPLPTGAFKRTVFEEEDDVKADETQPKRVKMAESGVMAVLAEGVEAARAAQAAEAARAGRMMEDAVAGSMAGEGEEASVQPADFAIPVGGWVDGNLPGVLPEALVNAVLGGANPDLVPGREEAMGGMIAGPYERVPMLSRSEEIDVLEYDIRAWKCVRRMWQHRFVSTITFRFQIRP